MSSISQFLNNLYCWIYFSCILNILFHSETKVTLSYLLSLAFTRFHLLYHWLWFVVTRCHSLSFVVPFVVTCCHLLYHSLSFFVTRCHSMYTRLSFYKRFSNGYIKGYKITLFAWSKSISCTTQLVETCTLLLFSTNDWYLVDFFYIEFLQLFRHAEYDSFIFTFN